MDLDIDRTTYEQNSGQEIEIEDFQKSFLCGIVEGFYGTPWSSSQREHLFYTLNRLKLNTYIYAPKDDQKHRKNWRDLYDRNESENISRLIACARQHGINFVYSISPGLDILYSCKNEREALKLKLQQVLNLGANGVGIFFDDIEPDLREQDAILYETYAAAQINITNFIFDALARPAIFLFCPTEYCTSRAKPSIIKSLYLRAIGETLNDSILIMWTGPRVISRTIPRDHCKELSKILKRKPIIWDNLHANDYDRHQVFLGPYRSRSLGIYPHISGIFLNPNCQYELNYIPMHSFSMWIESASAKYSTNLIAQEYDNYHEVSLKTKHEYNHEKIFIDCCRLWANEFNKLVSNNLEFDTFSNINTDISCLSPKRSDYNPSRSTDFTTEDNESLLQHAINQNDIYRICCFLYLPGIYGKFSNEFLSEFCAMKSSSSHFWKNNTTTTFKASAALENKWPKFKLNCDKVLSSIKKINDCSNRQLQSTLSLFINEIKETIIRMKSYINFLVFRENDPTYDELVSEPDTPLTRSRFATEVEKLLPSFLYHDPNTELFVHSPIYVIRPERDHDKERLETVCYGHLTNKYGVWDDLRPSKHLANLRYLESFFRSKYEMHIAEDSENLCGYMLHKLTTCFKLEKQLQIEYDTYVTDNCDISCLSDYFINFPPVIHRILQDYPMKVFFCFQVGFKKTNILLKLIEILMDKMEKNKIKGAHIIIDKFELIEPELLKNLGFFIHPDGNVQNNKYYVLENRQLV